ncbi:MAG: aquaporin family protein [Acidimicrobiaceae bacterium]|nr:aquaporin family protein [Acidimicrobiaceae bacterium]
MTPPPDLDTSSTLAPTGRAALAEGVGSFFLLATVVGSGIAATRLSPGALGLELLENALATGAVLGTLILTFAPLSGAHFNPLVTILQWTRGRLERERIGPYLFAQFIGAALGTVTANLMFAHPAITFSTTSRFGGHLWLGELVATLGLLLVVVGTERHSTLAGALAVGGYITGAYFFTSSTSFANPAVTVARTLSRSFAGIAPGSVTGFVVAQGAGLLVALGLLRLLGDARLTPAHSPASTKGLP